MKRLTSILGGLLALTFLVEGAPREFDTIPATYKEKYRPQFHYTPAHRWIGDPCGLIYHDAQYRAYCWGGAVSKDLVHWTEETEHAITNVPKGISCFTGSVVLDKNNTAKHGKDCLVAAFTSFDQDSKKQSQSVAFSHDGGKTFQYYDLNPVVDTWSTEFRDPTVIWDEKNQKWVMAVAKALEKKVAFYSSPDLKSWTWMSDFGPLGDSEKSWECPDLFQVSVDGNPENKKWVLLVSINWAREQYFIGDFDGEKFIPDNPDQYPLYVDEGLDYYASRVFQNPDDENAPVYTLGWVNTWDYAPTAPSTWGKGIWSVPREYSLKSTPNGLRLTQKPIRQLEVLRGKEIARSVTLKAGVTPLKEISAFDNTYEMNVDFSNLGTHPFGLYLCQGEGRKLTLTYDPSSQYLDIDRTNVADVEIPKFQRKSHVKIPYDKDGKLRLKILVDKSTVEIFTADGLHAMTLLTFAGEKQNGVSLFSVAPGVKASIKAYPLKSIWAKGE